MKLSKGQLKNIIELSLLYEAGIVPSSLMDMMLQPMKLRVLDFDDTIAHTGEEVKLYTQDGYRMLSSDEYATYVPKAGEYYDDTSFDQFSRVDIEKAKPVESVYRILMNFVNANEGNRRILILTARKQIVENDVRSFLESINIDHSAIDFVGVGSSDPFEKVRIISEYIENYNISFVSFFDDSIKNVSAVKEYLDSIEMENDVAHIKDDDGRIRLIRNFKIK